jgi:LysR family hydrogen peroxide-inducible transcriptional activator
MRYAVAVAETANFRLAASRCHVSQSGLSMQLQKLEELLGVTLFDRSKKPVLITDAGQTTLAQMRAVLRETERLGQLVSEGTEPTGPYRLGVIPTLSPTVLPLFLGTFVRRYPRVELHIEEMKTEHIIAALHEDQLDAGLAATPLHVRGLKETALGVESMWAYLPPDDPLLKKKSVSQSNLRQRALWVMPEGHCFRTQVLSYCKPEFGAMSGPVHFESGSFQTLIRLVDDGLGATILPALVVAELSAAKRKNQCRRLVSPTPVREIGLVRSREDLRRTVSDALVETIRDALAKALEPAVRSGVVLEPLG